MNISPIFNSFIANEKLSLDNDSIKKYCYKVSAESDKLKTTYFSLSEPELQEMFSEIQKHIDSVHSRLGFSNNFRQIIYNSWVNINTTPYTNQPHVHANIPKILLSGIYYPKAEDDAPLIHFISPISAHPYVIDPKTISENNEFTSSRWRVKPSTGDLILFPCWLQHYVEPTLHNEDRISIAFNTVIV